MKSKKHFLDLIAESDPDFAEIAGQLKADYAKGALRTSPRTHADCKDWWDVWLYIFRRCRLHPDDQIKVEGDKVISVVWIGPDFNDKVVALLEQIAMRLGPSGDVTELRLIRHRVSEHGIKRLKVVLPRATISEYTDADYDAKPWLAYADPKKAKQMFPTSFPAN